MDMFKELLKKKSPKPENDGDKKAKMDILNEIRGMASKEMGEEVKGFKPESPSEEKDEGKKPNPFAKRAEESKDECEKCSKAPCECEKSDEDEMSDEEIEAMIAHLEAKKSNKSKPSFG